MDYFAMFWLTPVVFAGLIFTVVYIVSGYSLLFEKDRNRVEGQVFPSEKVGLWVNKLIEGYFMEEKRPGVTSQFLLQNWLLVYILLCLTSAAFYFFTCESTEGAIASGSFVVVTLFWLRILYLEGRISLLAQKSPH